jgi:zinc/manganese transport system substrate-binding protein
MVRHRRHVLRIAGLCLATGLTVTACSARRSGPFTNANGKLSVVAAESFWGSIARQLGGDRVDVDAIVNSPDADPHDYEPTPQDARAVATAGYVILNGLGYDAWASDLVDANPSDGRSLLDVGHLLGLHTGDNPHRWYFPDDVTKVIDRITADYKALDPSHAAYYDEQHAEYTATALQPYRDAIAQIRAVYAGTPVAASESIVDGLAGATGLDVKTPERFLDAISEGNDPSASDKVTVDRQLRNREVAVFVYNRQNATPDVQRLVDEARDENIPVVALTETPVPAGASFQDWQTGQLHALASGLAEARQ